MYYVLENIYRKLSFNLCHADPRRSGKAAGRQRARCRITGRRLAQPAGGYPPSRPQGLARPRRLPAAKTQTGPDTI